MSNEVMNSSASEWRLAELLASPDSLYVLWLVYEGFGRNRYDIEARLGETFPTQSVIQELLNDGLLEQSHSRLILTALGREALSYVALGSGKACQNANQRRPSPMDKTMRIKQIRSAIGYGKSQQDTLRGLGLRGINHVVARENTPEVRGMINRIPHLVRVLGQEE